MTKNECKAKSCHSRYLPVQSQQWKHQSNVWNLFKVNNKDANDVVHTLNLFHTFFCVCARVSFVDFEQLNFCWVVGGSKQVFEK